MKHISLILAAICSLWISSRASADVLYGQPHDGSGTLYQSSWFSPDDSDWDQHVWDDFTLASSHAITEIRWRGGFIYGGQYASTVADFTVAIYGNSIAGEPDITHPPLVEYQANGNAGQAAAGTFAGVAMYDYQFTLPSPFQAAAGVKYWVYILAAQNGIPEWGLAKGTGGTGAHFRWLRGAHMYQWISGDTALTLYGSGLPTYTINASSAPANAGVIQGAGAYPSGASATLMATPNTGWGFWRWTEAGAPVNTSASYTFTVTADRTLLAEFVPAYTINTASYPSFGGSTTGGGAFNSGSSITVVATANPGFVFSSWTSFGNPVSTSASYTFSASANLWLVANFISAPNSMTFDFHNAPVYTSLPIDLSQGGLTAHLSATGGGFSIQPVGAVGISPAGFADLCLYPNTVFAADLIVAFSQPLTFFSIMYSPQELGCDDSATMRVTAYMNGSQVGTMTATAPNPGTYPTGTLLITVPAGFDQVIVHYDAPPPTCQDWGPIFLADNMTVTCAAAPCPADINNDATVNVTDLLSVINAWGPCPAPPQACSADTNADGQVNVIDLLAVINGWGNC